MPHGAPRREIKRATIVEKLDNVEARQAKTLTISGRWWPKVRASAGRTYRVANN
jgi:hypothetical protein